MFPFSQSEAASPTIPNDALARDHSTPNPPSSPSSPSPQPSNRPPRPPQKPPLIPLPLMEELLRSSGRAIYDSLKKGRPERIYKIWKNRNYGIDFGSTWSKNTSFKTWNLQINREASKYLKGWMTRKGYSTHAKLFRDIFNVADPPAYEVWVRSILSKCPKRP